MAAYIFFVDDKNYEICERKGLAGVTDYKDPSYTQEKIISQLAGIRRGDYILFYVNAKKEIRGVFKALEKPFYDTTQVWENSTYPFRVRIENDIAHFKNPIHLSDVWDLRDRGLIWTFAFDTWGGVSCKSITNEEFKQLLNLFYQVNLIRSEKIQTKEPYPYYEPYLPLHIDYNSKKLQYEPTLLSLILQKLADNKLKELFGNYSDYIIYVPTSFNKQIDLLLIYNHPNNSEQVMGYNIIEIKRDKFDERSLSQLLQYEDWFLRKKVSKLSVNHVLMASQTKFD
ncbi:MAG: EVE domain-containing protein [Firmicutes bacterium]|nr:EVE domain-containing protein [Bacillota bacterium]